MTGSKADGKINLPVYDETRCTLFALGRNAIYAACQMLGLRPGDEVLTPAFDCDGSLQPFRVLGLEIRFFRSDPYTLSVDIVDLKRRITTKTKLLHIINHFGMPQPWDDLLELRRETGIPILEDNAYSLFSSLGGRPFGSFGDLAVFSLRKNLPLIDGGLLRVNNVALAWDKAYQRNGRWLYPGELLGLLSMVKRGLGLRRTPKIVQHSIRRLYPAKLSPPPLFSEPGGGYPDCPERDELSPEFTCDYLRPISRLARFQLSRLDPEDYNRIRDRKRYWYTWLSGRVAQFEGVTVLWPDLPEGITPFCLSTLVDSKRDFFLGRLREKYDVMAWPTLSKLVLDQLEHFPEVEFLGRKLLQMNLPPHRVAHADSSAYFESLLRDFSELAQRQVNKSTSHPVSWSIAG